MEKRQTFATGSSPPARWEIADSFSIFTPSGLLLVVCALKACGLSPLPGLP
jgi:hypothetical protein